jgi:hypothetical protein
MGHVVDWSSGAGATGIKCGSVKYVTIHSRVRLYDSGDTSHGYKTITG